jgi:2-hydroxychromene-2-carboxylate isomerase
MAQSVRFYFDFVSPYSWLALMRAEAIAAEHRIEWDLRPVVYAALLDAHDLSGPAETPAKRRHLAYDVARAARHAGLRMVGPPAHPFRPIEALRTVTLFRETPQALRLAAGMAHAAWGEGLTLTDFAVLADVVSDCGLDAVDLEQRIAAPEVKEALFEATREAVTQGVFGVPTFQVGPHAFWGHDRMEALGRQLAGTVGSCEEEAEAFLGRPTAVVRRRR